MKTEQECIQENNEINKQIEQLRKKLNVIKFHVEAGDRGYYSLGKYYTLIEAERAAKTDADSWITPLTTEAKNEMALAGYR